MDNRRLVEDIYPLSPLQAGILFHTLEGAEPGMYFTQWVYELEGDLDLGAVRQAAERVLARHAALRTFFLWEKRESPVQVVLEAVQLPWLEQDWTDLAEAERERRLEEFLAADRASGFDLGKPPLLRFAAFRLGDGRAILVWSHHHILVDGWSLSLLFEEFAALHEEIAGGQRADLRPVRPYGDYIAWLRGRRLSASEEFWRGALAGFRGPTPVPLDSAPLDGSALGERYPQLDCVLSPAETDRLRRFARGHQLTLGTVVQGAWALLLARYAGLDDVVFGLTVNGRRPADLDGIEHTVGLFINTLPMRVALRPDDRLVPWLRRLQAQQIEILEHDYTPLWEIHGWSEVPRGVQLFETYLNFYNDPVAKGEGVARSALRVRSSRSVIEANYPLCLGISEEPELNLRICFDSRSFETAAVRRLQERLAGLLAAFAERAAATLDALPLADPGEARQLREWSGHAVVRPPQSVPELFEQAADRNPDATALSGDDQSLSYRELDRRANQLARFLRRAGVGPEVPVALWMERSIHAVIALLAVLKAGGVYLAVEPGEPEERLGALLLQARVPLLLTWNRDAHPPGPGVRHLDLAATADRIAGESGDRLPDRPAPENLAYVLFTSGSTGRPKAVAVEHRQIVHYVHAVRNALGLAPGMRYALVSTLAADLGHTSLYSALLGGGCLVVASREAAADPEALAGLFERHAVGCLKIVPSHLNALLKAAPDARVLPGERLVLGGEASVWEEIDRLRSFAPGCRIFNHYGPTESTVGVTTYDVLDGSPDHRACAHVPLGRALAGARLRVLDAQGQAAPPGMVGELFLGGAGLARGYLHDPAATAERFGPDPFSEAPGERLYRTGDRTRWLSGGCLEFLGRVDHQVKIRGFRVELGEIEAVLQQHPALGRAVAVVRKDGAEDQIRAYVVAATGAPAAEELRAFVAARLPQHMVPAVIAILDRLPLTPNGKVDRAALPDPAAPALAKAKVLPRTALERELAEVWREVLPLPEIAVEDDFFSLGGHSLRAMQLITRLRRRFLVELSLREFLSAPTIAGLAVVIAQKRAQQFAAEEVARVLEEMEEVPPGAAQAPAGWMAAVQENAPDGEPIDRHVEQKGGST